MPSKIVFMGTPDFAVESLKQLVEAGIEVVGVVTTPDRPAGRGQQLRSSAVKQFADQNNLRTLQPEKLKSDDFITELESLNADLFVIVAFRMLPEIVWTMPPKGTINLHGSLLPQYRGAAPINWAVINGDEVTGATTFFLKHEIDTGDIIDRVELPIGKTDTAGAVHDKLMVEGAALLCNSVSKILGGDLSSTPQSAEIRNDLKEAPKIFKADCKVEWSNSSSVIYNKIRGLSPYPTAWTEIESGDATKSIKLFDTIKHFDGFSHEKEIKVEIDQLYFGTSDGWIEILQLQLEGKKRMSVSDFLKGFNIMDWKLK